MIALTLAQSKEQQIKSLETQIKELSEANCGAEVKILWSQLNKLVESR
jgi:hypothetical protein